jgi:hypothetical protein
MKKERSGSSGLREILDGYLNQKHELAREIKNHLREHKGLPATTCHTCLGQQQAMMNLDDLIMRYEDMLRK